MEKEFTKGEWTQKGGQIYQEETGKTIALIVNAINPEAEANAKLIAVSPIMYDMLEREYIYILELPFKTTHQEEFIKEFEAIKSALL